MRCAIFAATVGAARLSNRVRDALEDETKIFVKDAYADGVTGEKIAYRRLDEAVGASFSKYDALIFIMATGIVVRMIAPYVKDKLADPAVVVIDECAFHVISLLSGHIGGANDLTRKLALALSSEAVITTATDVYGKLAVDTVAARLALDPYPRTGIKRINAAIIAGEDVVWILEENLRHKDFWRQKLKSRNLEPQNTTSLSSGQMAVQITDKCENNRHFLNLVPRRLIAGIGCRKGTDSDEILAALAEAADRVERDIYFVDAVASTVFKSNEAGLIQAAAKLSVKIYFGDNRALQEQIDGYRLTESAFVRQTIGVGNVAEAAALSYWHNELGKEERGRLALGKTKFGKVTVALLWQK